MDWPAVVGGAALLALAASLVTPALAAPHAVSTAAPEAATDVSEATAGGGVGRVILASPGSLDPIDSAGGDRALRRVSAGQAAAAPASSPAAVAETAGPEAEPPPASLALPVRGRLRPAESRSGAFSFGPAVLVPFARSMRLDFSAGLDVARSSGIVAVEPDLALDDVRDALGRSPIAQRLRVDPVFPAPIRFDDARATVPLSGRQVSLPGDARGPIRVVGHATVLRARDIARRELPPTPTDGVLVLAPGISLELSRFEALAREPENWEVAGRWNRQVASARQRYATPFVRALVLVDDQGDEVWRSPWPEAHRHEGAMASDFQVRFELKEGRRPATFRVEVVTAASEESVPFAVDLMP